MSVKIKLDGIVLEENGTRHAVETAGDIDSAIAFLEECRTLLITGSRVTFGSASGKQMADLPRVAGTHIISPLANIPATNTPGAKVPRYQSAIKQQIQQILDSGSNPPSKTNPPKGERGADYFVRSLVRLNAVKGSGVYATFPELCLDMLKQGLGIRSDTADKAIGSVRSMIRGTEIENLLEKKDDGICLLSVPRSAGVLRKDLPQVTELNLLSDEHPIETISRNDAEMWDQKNLGNSSGLGESFSTRE